MRHEVPNAVLAGGQMLQDRQTSDSLAGPEDRGSRVNLLNWDGKGSPPGMFPAAKGPDS